MLTQGAILLALAGFLITTAQGQTGNDVHPSDKDFYCTIAEIPTVWATGSRPVKIVHSDATFSELGTAVPALDVQNTQPFSITNIAFVLEYLDQRGKKLTAAAIASAAPGYETSMEIPFSVESVQSWKEPLQPGRIARVSGFYDSTRVPTCPQTSRVVFAMVRWNNGTIQRYAAKGWAVPPLPRYVPELTTRCPDLKKSPTQIHASVRLSSSGMVTGISGPIATRDDSAQVIWIANEIKKWKFQPALVDGKPRDEELPIDFVLYGEPNPNLGAISPTEPVTLISFFPSGGPGSRCVGSYGSLHEAKTFP